jgi:hypothetical protein
MSVATLDAPDRMAPATLHGEEPLAGRPAPPRWRLSLAIALLLTILLHTGLVGTGIYLARQKPRVTATTAIPITIVAHLPAAPKAIAPPEKPKPPPPPPKPEPAPPPAPPVPVPETPPEPEHFRESGPDQRTTTTQQKEFPTPSPPALTPAPLPQQPPAAEPKPATPKPAKPSPPTTRPPAKVAQAPPKPANVVPPLPTMPNLGPNGFAIPSARAKPAPEAKAQEPAAEARRPGQLSLLAPEMPGLDTAAPAGDVVFSNADMVGDPYLNMLRDRVAKYLPKQGPDSVGLTGRVLYRVGLTRDGRLASVESAHLSRIERLEQIGDRAIRQGLTTGPPVPPVPSDFPGNPVVYFTASFSLGTF